MDYNKEKEMFLAHRELAGATGYCNPTFAAKIADYWIERMRLMLESERAWWFNHEAKLLSIAKEKDAVSLRKHADESHDRYSLSYGENSYQGRLKVN